MRTYIMNEIDKEHLKEVKAEMNKLGAPTVRAFFDGEVWFAIEGSHRLTAALELGIEPEIEEVEYNDDEISIQWGCEEDQTFIASELANMLFSNRNAKLLVF